MKTETGITKSWPYRKSFRSGTLVMSFGCSKEFYKNTFPFSSIVCGRNPLSPIMHSFFSDLPPPPPFQNVELRFVGADTVNSFLLEGD